jgi:IclR family pca regulon transcriptional regulator
MLLLALSEPQAIDHWLATHRLKPYTTHTITDATVLRGDMDIIRAQRWCLSEQQLELDMRGIAVPLIDLRGDLIGALNVTMPMGKESPENAVRRVLPILQETARAMRNLI